MTPERDSRSLIPPMPQKWRNAALSNNSDAMLSQLEWLDALFMRRCIYTYLHNCLCAYKTANISETVEDRAKVTIIGGNGPYKIVHGLSIAAKMYRYDLNEIQGH